MGTGYTRNDVSNNIADGNIINASDLDGEFDAVESAFNSSTGHTHDGTAAEGGAITVVGPVQDLVVSATEVKPKTTNTLDLGTSALLYKDAYLQGNMYFRDTALKIVSSTDGQLDIDADVELEVVAPTVDIDASTALTVDTASTTFTSTLFNVTGSANITGDLDVDNININGNTIISTDTNGAINITPNGTGAVNITATTNITGDLDVDNINVNGNTVSSTDTNGDINLSPNGTGTVVINTDLDVDNININGNTISSTDTNGNLTIDPNGTGDIVLDANVGIGTSSPNSYAGYTALTLNHATNGGIIDIERNGTLVGEMFTTDANTFSLAAVGAKAISFNTNSTERMRIDSGGRVGIGVVPPSGAIPGLYYTGGGATYSTASTYRYDMVNAYFDTAWKYIGNGVATQIYQANGQFIFNQASSNSSGAGAALTWDEAVRIDSSGNLLVGTTSANFSGGGRGLIELNGSSDSFLALKHGDTAGLYLYTASGEGRVAQFANLPMTFFTNNTERMRIDSSGNVGIGTASPARTLSAYSSSSIPARIESSTTDSQIEFVTSGGTTNIGGFNGNIVALTGGSERLRIDSSGNLLVGRTTNAGYSANSVALSAVSGNGSIFDGTGNTVAFFNRRTSDGEILSFSKDGSTVGDIGVNNSDNLRIQGNSSHSGIEFGTNAIFPHKSSSNVDATIDLGESTLRWKNLYLSGGVYLGGTGAANHLDDYEEGTWNVTIVNGSLTPTSVTASYTKIGNRVFLSGQLVVPTNSESLYMALAGLPFATSGDSAGSLGYTTATTSDSIGLLVQASTIYFYKDATPYATSEFSNKEIRISAQYRTG